jgi:hypothetical protein
MRQRRCTDSMAVSSTPPMNGEELQAAGRSPAAVQLTIVGTARSKNSNFVKFFSKAVGQLSSVSCVSSSPVWL